MDNKSNDDSAGSDSLDKSLQKKCIVDDFGDGTQQQKISMEQPSRDSGDAVEQLKTDDVVDDCSGAGGETALSQQGEVGDFTMVAGISNNAALKSTITISSDSGTTNTSSKSSSSSLPFETKVKQIAKDLKGTCLADDNAVAHSLPEEAVAMCNKITLEDASSSSSSSDVEQNVTVDKDSSSPPPATQEPSLDCSVNPLQPDDEDLETSRCSTEDNDDDEPHSSKSKKVHFHPEVKEHDGGNRVIPKKKKKKTKETKRLESEMDQDEDEDEADEEDSITKVMAEAEEHLNKNPLFEESPDNSTRPRLRDGLLEEEDVKDTAESSEEEDLHANDSPPMNGVQRVLGKMIKNNKVFYLVRYVAKETIVGWEAEEFITKECAPLLNDYETHCIKLQERMMRHVSKCQKRRQRYTDF